MSGDYDPAAWDLFLRRMIAYNFRVFGLTATREGESLESGEGDLNKLCKWNTTQSGLHAMLEFQTKLKKLGQDSRTSFKFDHEMK